MASSALSEYADPEALYLRYARNQAVHEAAKYGYVEEVGWVSMARLGGWVGGWEEGREGRRDDMGRGRKAFSKCRGLGRKAVSEWRGRRGGMKGVGHWLV